MNNKQEVERTQMDELFMEVADKMVKGGASLEQYIVGIRDNEEAQVFAVNVSQDEKEDFEQLILRSKVYNPEDFGVDVPDYDCLHFPHPANVNVSTRTYLKKLTMFCLNKLGIINNSFTLSDDELLERYYKTRKPRMVRIASFAKVVHAGIDVSEVEEL